MSKLLPPWLLRMIPSMPCFMASLASAAVWIPLSTIGSLVALRNQAMSFQFNEESMYAPIVLPSPPPLISFFAAAPLTGENDAFVSAFTFSSASRFPGMGASTVTKTAFAPPASTCLRRVSEACLFLLTYSWKKKVWPGATAVISPNGKEALEEIFSS